MANLKHHFKSICFGNYDTYREPLSVHFEKCGADRKVNDFSVRYVDGYTKGLICQSLVAIIDHIVACLVF